MNSIIEKILSRIFPELNQDHLIQIFEMGRVILAQPKQVITDPGDQDHSLYICLSGVVKINYSNETGEEVSLAYLNSGELFGELSAIDEQTRSASCIAKTDCSLLKIPQQEVQKMIVESPEFNRALMLVLVNRIRRTDDKLYSLAKLSAGQRVIEELIGLATRSLSNDNEGEILFIPRQNELGLLAMVSREKASRIFNELRKLDLIEKRATTVFIPSIAALRDYSQKYC